MNIVQLNQFGLKYRLLGETIQAKWDKFLDFVGDDPEMLWTVGSTIVLFVVYWGYASLFTLMDITSRPKFLRKYKVQPGQNEPMDKTKFMNAIKMVLINQTVVTIPFSYVTYRIYKSFHQGDVIHMLPHLTTVIIQLGIFSLLEEIMFYYSHRLLHHKSIYKYFHKKHHEWTAPIAAITLYSHPIEHIISNMLPVALSIALLRAHLVTAWLMTTLAIVNSMTDHSGYSFPFSAASVRFHDLHHEKFNYNYGVLGILDKLHGTFRDSTDKPNAQKQLKNGRKKNKSK